MLDNQRWKVAQFKDGYALKPVREYGPQPETGDELVPATALDKAIAALQQIKGGANPKKTATAALKDLSR